MEKSSTVNMLFVGFVGAVLAVVSIAFADSKVARDVFEALRATSTAVAALVGVTIAYRGLETWKRQLRGAAHFDSCRKFLLAVYRLRDEFASIRSPLRQITMKPDETHQTAYNRDLLERHERLASLMRECEVAAYDVEAMVGTVVRDWLKDLRRPVIKIAIAIESYIKRSGHQDQEEMLGVLHETHRPRSEEFTSQIKKAIDAVENSLGPVIRDRA